MSVKKIITRRLHFTFPYHLNPSSKDKETISIESRNTPQHRYLQPNLTQPPLSSSAANHHSPSTHNSRETTKSSPGKVRVLSSNSDTTIHPYLRRIVLYTDDVLVGCWLLAGRHRNPSLYVLNAAAPYLLCGPPTFSHPLCYVFHIYDV